MKKIFLFLFVVVLVSCKKDAVNKNNQNLFYYLPNNPSVVIQSNSLEDFNSIINNNELIQKFSNTVSYKKIQSNFSFTKDLNKENEFVIGFAEVGKDYEFLLATKKDNNKLNKGEKKEYNNHEFYKINEHTFTMDLDSTTIVSSSELLLENLVRNNTNNISYDNNSLKKLIKANLDNELNVFINLEKKPHFLNSLLPTKFLSKTNWTSLSFNGENGINSNGTATDITIGDDFINSISKGENNETYAGSIIPYNYTNYTSFHYKDLTSFKTNFDNFSELINISDEVVYISDDTNNVIAFHLQDHNFIDNLNEIENYRNTTIYQNNYYKIPASLIKPQPSFACLIDNFLILSDKKEALQNTIAHYQNKTTLNHQAFFKETIAEALRESHINISKKTSKLTNQLAEVLTDKSIKKVDLKDYPLFNQQVNYEDILLLLNF